LTGRETFFIKGSVGGTDFAEYSLFFTPDGRRLITGNRFSGGIMIWDAGP
jgi:hypothetical protein